MIAQQQIVVGRQPVRLDVVTRLGVALAVLGCALSLVGGRATSAASVDGYGLLRALPVSYWLGVGVAVIASALLLLVAADTRPSIGAAVPIIWLLVLHTAPALAHPLARGHEYYAHVGLIRALTAGDGALDDTRSAWPGFHGPFLPSLAELDPRALDGLVRIWPTLVTAAAAVLVAALARRSYPNRHLVGPVSALMFVVGAWSAQDAFRATGLGLVGYLAIVTVVEGGPLRPRGSWSSIAPVLSRFATAGGDRPEARSTPSFAALVILALGSVGSQPLTPLFIGAALAVLGLYGRTVAWRLLAIAAAAYLLWIVTIVRPWSGDEVIDGLDPFRTFGIDAGDRPRGDQPSSARSVIGAVRLLLALATIGSTMAISAAMASDRLRHLRPALPLAPMTALGVVVVGFAGTRSGVATAIVLFSLPAAAILTTRLLLEVPRHLVHVVVPVMTVVAVPFFLAARFGDESFEMVRQVDREAVVALYEAAAPGDLLLADNPAVPWGDQARPTNVHSYTAAEPTRAWLDAVAARALAGGSDRVLVVFTPSQSAWREQFEGQPPASLDEIGWWLSSQSDVDVIAGGAGAWVFALAVEG